MSTSKINTSYSELREIVKETGVPEISNLMDSHLDRFRSKFESTEWGIQFLVYAADPAQADFIREAISAHPDFHLYGYLMKVRCLVWGDAPNVQDEMLSTIMNVLVFLPGYETIEAVFQHAEVYCGKVPAVLVCGNADQKAAIEKGLSVLSSKALFYGWAAWLPNVVSNLDQIIKERITPAQFDNLRDYALAQALDDIKETFLLAVSVEDRSLKARRQINQQQLAQLKTKSGNSWHDLIAHTKNNLQTQSTLFEKSVNSRVENAFKRQSGDYWPQIENWLQSVAQLEEETKARSLISTISQEKAQEFIGINENYLLKFGTTDLKLYKDVLDLALQELDAFLQKYHLPSVPFHTKYITQERLQGIVQGLLQIEKTYKSEQTRRGGYEYFMAARKYQMLLMMTFSTFGLSFVKGIKIYMMPLTFFLLALGIINVMRTVKQEKEEAKARELERAREMLTGEAKRISTEFSRNWGRFLTESMKEQLDQILVQLEIHIKSFFQQQAGLEEAERNRIQRILAGLETQERRFENVRRNLTTWERNFLRVLTDLQTAYRQTNRSI